MNDLLKKLNILARSKIGDLAPALPRFERTPDLDRQANDLRQRINDTLDHEDKLQAAAQALRDEVARLDAAADSAIAQGRDAEARHLLDQLKRTEQRLTIAESDLRAHQRSAEDLIQRVNMLEAAIADKRAAAANRNPSASPQQVEIPTGDTSTTVTASAHQALNAAHQQADKTENTIQKISNLIKEAQDRTRERITMMGELLSAKETASAPTAAAPAPSASPSPDADDASRPENIRPRSPVMQLPIEQSSTEPAVTEPAPAAPSAKQTPAPTAPNTAAPKTKSETEDDAFARRLKRLAKPE